MIEKIRISLIIPVYNSQRWIKACIDSTFREGNDAFEIIVVNDGSTDSTTDILRTYESHLRLISQRNLGVAAARNTGIQNARGNYIRFLDSDDELPENSMELCRRAVASDPGLVVVGKAKMIDEYGALIDRAGYNLPQAAFDGKPMRSEYLITQATSSGILVVPTLVAAESGGFDTKIRIGEEFGFIKAMLQRGVTFAGLDAHIYNVRNHSGVRLSRSAKQSDHVAQALLIHRCYEFVSSDKKGPHLEARKLIAEMCWSNGRHCLRIGYHEAASSYFALADSVGQGWFRKGKLPYHAMAAAVGPYSAEIIIEKMKKLMRS